MTDQDRGAYTPFADEPLSFDPREAGRRPMPMTLILSGLVLIGLVGGVGLIYSHGVRHADDTGRVIGQPVLKVKTAPPAAAASNTVDQAPDVYSASTAAQANTTAAPTFTPPPEQPAPRVAVLPPAPPLRGAKADAGSEYADAAGLTTKTPSSQAAAPVASAPASADDSAGSDAVAPAQSVKAADERKQTKREAAHVKTARAATAEDTAAEVSKPAKASAKTASAAADDAGARVSGPVVQIGAFASNAQAARGWNEMAALMSDHMSGKTKHVLKIEKGGQTFYRTWVAGFGSRADAQAFCEALKAKGKACLVKG